MHAGIKEEIFVETLFTASTHDALLFFTDAGKVYWLKVHEIPGGELGCQGQSVLVNLLALSRDRESRSHAAGERIPAPTGLSSCGTKQGVIKTELVGLQQPRCDGYSSLSLDAVTN